MKATDLADIIKLVNESVAAEQNAILERVKTLDRYEADAEMECGEIIRVGMDQSSNGKYVLLAEVEAAIKGGKP